MDDAQLRTYFSDVDTFLWIRALRRSESGDLDSGYRTERPRS